LYTEFRLFLASFDLAMSLLDVLHSLIFVLATEQGFSSDQAKFWLALTTFVLTALIASVLHILRFVSTTKDRLTTLRAACRKLFAASVLTTTTNVFHSCLFVFAAKQSLPRRYTVIWLFFATFATTASCAEILHSFSFVSAAK